MPRFSSDDDVSILQGRVPVLIFLVLCFVLVVVIRLYYLQINRGVSYRSLSEQISVREEQVMARRGLILDRSGHILADSRPYFEIVVIPQHLKNREKTLEALARLIPVTKVEMKEKLSRAHGEPAFMPVVLVEDAPYDWVARLKEFERPSYEDEVSVYLEGVEVRTQPMRVYHDSEVFSHAVGYIKEVDKTLLKTLQEKEPGRYVSGDMIGASGLEKAYDSDLRGTDGVIARVVDARGREIFGDPETEMLADRLSVAPVDGNHLVTSLDYDAQMAAHQGFNGRRGAAVALDPNTGEVIVLYSSPGYDANRIVGKIDKDYWRKINEDPQKFLYNRAIQTAQPPGSTYKFVTAFAGLDSGKITTQTHFGCGGGMQFGNRYFQCWNKGGHGSVEVIRAITQSCDVFFYNTGIKVGVDELARHARLLGMGEKTGIEIPYEQPGLIPTSEWKMKRYKQPWIESETLSISIGQGYDLVTPIQNARMVAMIANGGRPLTPHLGLGIMNGRHEVIRAISRPLGEPVMRPADLEIIRKGAIAVVHGAGTAGRLKASPFKIAGKTGTAQVVGYDSKVRGERAKDHAWFVAYAPYDDPKIAMVVFVEHGGHGGSDAAPVAKAVIDTYLSKTLGWPEGYGPPPAPVVRP